MPKVAPRAVITKNLRIEAKTQINSCIHMLLTLNKLLSCNKDFSEETKIVSQKKMKLNHSSLFLEIKIW